MDCRLPVGSDHGSRVPGPVSYLEQAVNKYSLTSLRDIQVHALKAEIEDRPGQKGQGSNVSMHFS